MLSTSMQRLSSGLRINSSADDVAGYAISERMQGQVNGLNQATQNIADAVSLAQTGQGALNDILGMLQRIRSLAVEFANGTTSEEDKEAIETDAEQLTQEIETASTGAALRRLEDPIDAIMCAYVGLLFRADLAVVIGDAQTGAVVTPVRDRHRRILGLPITGDA